MKKVQYLKIMAAAILGISGMFAPQPGTLTGEKLTATVYANGEDLSVFENSGKYIKKEDDGLYCVDQDGSPDVRCAVHYFDHFAVDGKMRIVNSGYSIVDADYAMSKMATKLVTWLITV